MADYIRPTPRNPILGLLADALTGGVEWMRDPRRAQQMQGLGGLLAETGIPATVERLSYGEPLTTGRGMTTRLRPEAEAALMTLGPEAVPIGRGAMAAVRATKGLPVGMGIKNVGNEAAYLQSLRPVDVFGNGRRIDYYDDAKGLMYSAQEYPKGTRWTAWDVLPKSEGGNQVIGEMDRFRSFADVVAGVRGARISEAAKARNAKYDAIPNTWSGEAKKIGKSLIDAGVEIDRFSSSNQSKSKYIYLENGKKIRISDHELPNAYDAPEFDFRYGGDVKSLVKQIKDDQAALLDEENSARLEEQLGGLLGR